MFLCGQCQHQETVNVRGQLNIVDHVQQIEQENTEPDNFFENLTSLRIAREYLQRKIAEERRQQEEFKGAFEDGNSPEPA
ncbi:unnamed protein product [Cylicocyclus nassatus]|uniref:Uncharacterized protein n=1 Tax=Cylicocyclus nassatus TaxID=53992 RepID=A0AA36GYR9_CYLNA|nr:unnamed protein product [Cylicocyclus nassatus]